MDEVRLPTQPRDLKSGGEPVHTGWLFKIYMIVLNINWGIGSIGQKTNPFVSSLIYITQRRVWVIASQFSSQ